MGKKRAKGIEMDFEMDERYAVCTRELWLSLAFFVVNVLVVFALAYGLGYQKSVEQLSYVFGFPTWFFWGGIVATIISSVGAILLVRFGFKEIPITASGREEGND